MWLDDRPVIDQLTAPTPARILTEELDKAHTKTLNAEDAIRVVMHDRLNDALEEHDVELTDDVREAVRVFVAEEAGYVVDYATEAVRQYADEAINRVEGNVA